MSIWSDEARVLVRPFSTYSALKASEVDSAWGWRLVRRPLLWLLVIASFVSLTTAGRLVWFHFVFAMLAWLFVPLLQMFWVGVVARVVAPQHSWAEVVDLFYVGQGPWLLLATMIAGVCLFVHDTWLAFQWLLDSGVMGIAILVTAAWAVFLTVAFFRSGLGMGRARSVVSTLMYYGGFVSTIVLYYTTTGQLLPLLFGDYS